MQGSIHSVETFGTVDGPGLRYVIFTQGCKLRCEFCHNPDTWKMSGGKEMSVEELVDDILNYLPFFQASGGGVTVSGGEPLLQAEFLVALFKELKKHGIHTTIDTSGGVFNKSPKYLKTLDELLELTDLVMLDLKQIDPDKHRKLTGLSNEHILDFANHLKNKDIAVWIRHVLIPERSDFDEDLHALRDFIDTMPNVEKVEVLPYHKLGVYKYEALGLDYPLEGIEPPSEDRVRNAEAILGC